jgi:hypothetical protein
LVIYHLLCDVCSIPRDAIRGQTFGQSEQEIKDDNLATIRFSSTAGENGTDIVADAA